MATMTPHSSDDAEEMVTTVIADDLHIKGTITFQTSLMIKGSLEGEIISEGLLVVGPTAKIGATIVTKSLISHGQIQGDVTASDRVVLKGTAVQTGNITTPYIVVENGSTFNGSCVMKREKSATPARETNESGTTEYESRYEGYQEPAAEGSAGQAEGELQSDRTPEEPVTEGTGTTGSEETVREEGSTGQAEGEIASDQEMAQGEESEQSVEGEEEGQRRIRKMRAANPP